MPILEQQRQLGRARKALSSWKAPYLQLKRVDLICQINVGWQINQGCPSITIHRRVQHVCSIASITIRHVFHSVLKPNDHVPEK
jgi:hypothetical protein